MRRLLAYSQFILGMVMLAATLIFASGWLALASGWADSLFEGGVTLFTFDGKNCIDIESHSLTWGDVVTRSVPDPSGRTGIELTVVAVLTIPNWLIVLILSVISACLLLLTPQSITTKSSAVEHGPPDMAAS